MPTKRSETTEKRKGKIPQSQCAFVKPGFFMFARSVCRCCPSRRVGEVNAILKLVFSNISYNNKECNHRKHSEDQDYLGNDHDENEEKLFDVRRAITRRACS